ncbi:hypothetical protein Droror1_Dr00000765 [Drosera rotundifolia]
MECFRVIVTRKGNNGNSTRREKKKRTFHSREISISVRNTLSSVKSPADWGFSRTATSANTVAAGALPFLFLHISTLSTESLASDRSRQRSSNWSSRNRIVQVQLIKCVFCWTNTRELSRADFWYSCVHCH